MFNITSWPLKRLLVAGLSFLILAVLVVATTGIVGQRQAQGALRTVYLDRAVPLGDLGRIQHLTARDRIGLQDAVMRADATHTTRQLANVDASTAETARLWKGYMATYLTPEEAAIAARLEQALAAFRAQAVAPTAEALRAGDYAAARELLLQRFVDLNAAVEQEMGALIALQVRVAEQEFNGAESVGARLSALALATTAMGLVLGGLAGVVIVRTVNRRLGADPAALAGIVHRVASGDLGPVEGADRAPAGSVLAAIRDMRDNLARVVGQVRSGSDSIATASSQIAQGNQDLSGRTEQQASSLQETAASMEQLGSTVKQNADNARQANQLAQGASEVAVKGGEVVAQVVDTMKGIQASSKRIADIIGTIDGIAFQTNILALNAAVEAARAGEQGRGFAVVAGEVRTLARRSAEAAKEIKSLITDSVERVESGSALADQAGTTMDEVVGAIRRVTDIMGEISAASTEQSQGVSQVGDAVSQMDQVTQQNAALVEESAAAAESLKQQAEALVQAVAVFRLAAGHGSLGAPSYAAVAAPAVTAPTRRAAAQVVAKVAKATPPAARTVRSERSVQVAQTADTSGEWTSF